MEYRIATRIAEITGLGVTNEGDILVLAAPTEIVNLSLVHRYLGEVSRVQKSPGNEDTVIRAERVASSTRITAKNGLIEVEVGSSHNLR